MIASRSVGACDLPPPLHCLILYYVRLGVPSSVLHAKPAASLPPTRRVFPYIVCIEPKDWHECCGTSGILQAEFRGALGCFGEVQVCFGMLQVCLSLLQGTSDVLQILSGQGMLPKNAGQDNFTTMRKR